MNVYVSIGIIAFFAVNAVTQVLPTMSRKELLEITVCTSNSCNQTICDKGAYCLTLFIQRVKVAYNKCNKIYNPTENKKCDKTATYYPTDDAIGEIYDCIGENTAEFTDEENDQMRKYEDCKRDLYKECLKSNSCNE